MNADELLKQKYVSAKDLTIIIPNLKMQRARTYINELQKEMEKDGYFIPICYPKIVLTSYVKNKFFKKGKKDEFE